MTHNNFNRERNPYRTPNTEMGKDTALPPEANAGYRMNGLWMTGLIINTFVALMAAVGYGMGMGIIIGIFWILCVLGTVLILSGAPRVGKGVFIAGSIGFVPIGLIAVFCMRKADETVVARDFWREV